MSDSDYVKPTLLDRTSLSAESTLYAASDDRPSQQLLRNDFEEFDVEAQPSTQHACTQNNGVAARAGAKLADLFRPCAGPVLYLLNSWFAKAVLYLSLGLLGLIICGVVFALVGVVTGKIVAWVIRATGLIP